MPNIYVSDETYRKFSILALCAMWGSEHALTDDTLVDRLVTRELDVQQLAAARQVVGEEHD